MKLKNDSRLKTEDILSFLSKYEKYFIVEVIDDIEIVKNDGDYPFANASDGILFTNGAGYKYGGLAYSFGACTIFIHDDEIQKFGDRQMYLYENRCIHEILHHFDKPCHDIDNWCKKNIIYWLLWFVIAKKNGETVAGSFCERQFYKVLLNGINEKEFNWKYEISKRTYNGAFKGKEL